MGQKANPIAVRIGLNKTWSSVWFAKGKTFAENLVEDFNIRRLIETTLGRSAAVAQIEIARDVKTVRLKIHTGRPGMVIGRLGQSIEKVRTALQKAFPRRRFELEIIEVKAADLSAKIVADNIAIQIEKRISYRRAAKQAIERTLEAGAKGIKIVISGRLAGAEIARRQLFVAGSVPTGTFSADIDFAISTAFTTWGTIGVRVWIHRPAPKGREGSTGHPSTD